MKLTGKRANNYRWRMVNSNKYDLFECYQKSSAEKILAYSRCKAKMLGQHGYNFTILSHNAHTFTVGWITEEAPNRYTLHVETYKNSYEMEFNYE